MRARSIKPDGRSPRLVKFTCGIYEIRHESGRRYVGSSCEVEKRLYYHVVLLRVGKHHCGYLQNVWNKYRGKGFTFRLLEVCSRELLNCREQFHMDKRSSLSLMNAESKARSVRGWRHSEETKRKMSVAAKRVASSPEERAIRSERAKRQWAQGNIGRWR